MTVTGGANNSMEISVSGDGRCPQCGETMNTGGCPRCSQHIRFHVDDGQAKRLEPFKCPCCDGTGKVSRPPWIAGDLQELASGSIGTYSCQACNGTGVVWG